MLLPNTAETSHIIYLIISWMVQWYKIQSAPGKCMDTFIHLLL